jgi:hypothetical protein
LSGWARVQFFAAESCERLLRCKASRELHASIITCMSVSVER